MVLELLATVLSPALTQMLTRDSVCGNQPSCLLIMHGNYTEPITIAMKQEAQLMLTTGSTRLAVSRGQQIWYHSTCNI